MTISKIKEHSELLRRQQEKLRDIERNAIADLDRLPVFIAKRLRALGITLQGAADLAGVTRFGFWSWLTGRTLPRESSVKPLADALGVPVESLRDIIELDKKAYRHRGKKR